MTACYDVEKMIMGRALGVKYIAPYFGPMRDADLDAITQMHAIHAISSSFQCRSVIASLQNSRQMVE